MRSTKKTLESTHPHLVTQWHPMKNDPLSPTDVTHGSSKKVWWVCDEGHEWEASIGNRALGRGCPVCSNRLIIAGVNDLASRHPGVANEWDSAKNSKSPTEVPSGSGVKYWWLCDEGHSYSATPQKRTIEGTSCPYCSGQRVKEGFNDLASQRLDIAAQWHPTKNKSLTPQKITVGSSGRSVWWLGGCGHEWSSSVHNRTREGSRGCPVCSGNIVSPGVNDLVTTHPDLAAQWHPTRNGDLEPKEVISESNRKVWWVNKCGHEWESTIENRKNSSSTYCPVCSNNLIISGVNDLVTTHPDLAAQWHPTRNQDLEPTWFYQGSRKSVWWQCNTEAHDFYMSIASFTKREACPHCSGARVTVGISDLATTHPDIASQWHPTQNRDLLPSDFSHGSDAIKIWWVCPVGHEWETPIYTRTSGSGCPYCSGRVAVKGVNDLVTTHPEIAAEWHPTKNAEHKPYHVKLGTSERFWWQCKKGHEWEAFVYNRTLAESNCPYCAFAEGVSKGEDQLASMIEDAGIKVQRSVRTKLGNGNRKELDIYLPEYDVAIEFNGLYWHSDLFKDKSYHYDKWRACHKEGIQLIQVWEDDWRDRPGIIKNMILHKLGVADLSERVFARKCRVVSVPGHEAQEFLNSHHIQGSVSGSHYLGLRSKSDNSLVAVMVLKKQGQDMLLARYATAVPVPGGQSKLVKYAERNLDYANLITFADLEVSEGVLYEKTGFHKDRKIPPDYSYMYEGRRQHKFGFRLARFRSDPQLKYEEGLSERELAAINRIPRIWDSGKVRYVKPHPKKN